MTNTKQPQATAAFTIPEGLHHNTATLVRDFAEAMAKKLRASEIKYGWTANWMRRDWRAELAVELLRHVHKGDPIDVAAYAAFAWFHGWSVAPVAASATYGGQVATVIPYTDEDGGPDHEMDNWRMIAIGRPGDIPEHVLDRIPALAAEIIRQHSEAQATEIVRLKGALEADYDLVTRELAARTAEFLAMKDRATKAEAQLADHIKEDEAWSGDVVQAVLDLVGIDDPDPDGYYAHDLKSMLDDYDAAFTDVTALAVELAIEMTRARDVMAVFIDEHSDPGTDAMASHHCMSALIRKAATAGLLARTPTTLIDRIPANHTPGGWNRNIPPAHKYSVIFAGRNTHVCRLSINGLSDEEIEANANLIAAAPDLLEALQAAAHLLRAAGVAVDAADTQAINRAILRACGGAR
ncbi:hypothetical protein D3877_16235 [Azospirillum cavernae]|uniref:Uncharacterized protein n=1 Tax=Azospirillum cavernae TaxID=2320860 RepID=A0A418VX08_9PROT|nr:hypothetical protein [Azospirillum cavernae]RJF81670.1 hypothetical protein D3877_16235 [Azospirillum cavernae]